MASDMQMASLKDSFNTSFFKFIFLNASFSVIFFVLLNESLSSPPSFISKNLSYSTPSELAKILKFEFLAKFSASNFSFGV